MFLLGPEHLSGGILGFTSLCCSASTGLRGSLGGVAIGSDDYGDDDGDHDECGRIADDDDDDIEDDGDNYADGDADAGEGGGEHDVCGRGGGVGFCVR